MARPLVAVLVAVLLVAGCSGSASPAPVSELTPSAPPTSPAPPPPPPALTFAFAGDVNFHGRNLRLLDDPATAFGPIAETLRAADFAMVNLETAVTDRGSPQPKEFHFRAPPTAYDAAAAAGVDVVSLANNHTLDYGQVGFADTLRAAKGRIPYVGAGHDADAAYRPWYTTVKGVRVAVLAFSQITELAATWVATDTRPGLALAITDDQIARAAAAIRSARAAADIVVVFMHWGQEYNECPIALQRTAASAFAAAGATIVVGTHAHVMQGSGWIGDTYVAYGMSNFIWYINNPPSNDTNVVQVHLTGSSTTDVSITGVEFVPAVISRTTGQPIPVSGAEAERVLARHERLHACTRLAAAPSG